MQNVSFDQIKRTDANGRDFWLAKELQVILDCKNWKTMNKLVYKVANKISKQHINIDNHMLEISRKLRKGNEIIIIDDFTLSEYATKLIIEEYIKLQNKKNTKKESKTHKIFNWKNVLIAMTTCGILSLSLVLSIMYIDIDVFKQIRNLYISTAMTTRRFQWAAKVFFSEEDINKILEEIIPPELAQKTNTNILNKNIENTIELVEIKGNSYIGKLLIIGNPAKVCVKTSKNFLNRGQLLAEMVEESNAIAGINGSGFVDYNGTSLGGEPVGIVIENGKLMYLPAEENIKIAGLDYNDNLIVGRFNKNELQELNLRDAVEPFYLLTINGEDRIQSGDGGYGLQPRTAIGQTIDGKILLLTIDGRKLDSIGATMKDVQDILTEYGAINCAALDGGSSTVMYYDGEVINRPSTLDGGNTGRYLPSAFIVYK